MAHWNPLSAPQSPDGALLYVKVAFAESSYTIFLTDLIRIWVEKLDRRAIMRRAMDENTTIDPTNGPDQLRHLLEHIEKCLQGDPDTRTVISSKSDMQNLKLTLTSKLPAPLEPFRWPITLKLEDQACFSFELLLPSLRVLQDYRQGLDGLLSVIKEKDSVIQKLQDKLEVAGIDIGAGFPGIGSSKASKSSRAAYLRAVPGLKEFSYEDWVQEAPGLVHDPHAHDILPRLTDMNTLNAAAWWERLPASDTEIDDYVADSQAKASSGTQFSVPERQKSSRKGSASSTTTEGEFFVETKEDVSVPTKQEVVPESLEEISNHGTTTTPLDENERLKQPAKRIGKLGGKRASPGPASLESTPAPKTSNPPTSPPRKVSKLGRIGGASKANETRTSPQSDPQTAAPSNTQVKRESSVENEVVAGASRDRQREERETSEERANRRRAELKRQLEEKKKAAGTKKKQRKF
jgi:XLF-Cernunnos, XRcc4-like factor, NHEJ component